MMLHDTDIYRRYRRVLLEQKPTKVAMGLPTYLLVSIVEAEFVIHGEQRGGRPKGDFRERLRSVVVEL